MMNFVMYTLLFIGVVCVVKVEKKDWDCSNRNPYAISEMCIPGEGNPYKGTTPVHGDDVPTLLEKIQKAASVENRSVKWRRSLILGFSICILLWILVISPGHLPEWPKMYLSVILAAGVLYYGFNYYSYHMFDKPKENIEKCVKGVREGLVL